MSKCWGGGGGGGGTSITKLYLYYRSDCDCYIICYTCIYLLLHYNTCIRANQISGGGGG